MSEIRQRNLGQDVAAVSHSIATRSKALNHPRRFRKVFIVLILSTLCLTYLFGVFQSQWFDGLAKSLGFESVHYHAVIIDAGSSGSRVLAYKFREPFSVFGAKRLELAEEYFEQTKPGLSSYADDPAKGADTIVQLIKKAEFLIPPEKRKDTPLVVRATAGLRLLPKEKAQALIDHVAQAISKLGYSTDNRSVEIMDGADEGIFIWFTVNFLHNRLQDESMAALDLGGGSTQVTFRTSEEVAATHFGDTHNLPVGGNNITLYTHSYLKMGLHAARYGVLKLEAEEQGKAENSSEFQSVCVEPIVQKESWFYNNKANLVSGVSQKGLKRDAVVRRCRSLVSRYVSRTLGLAPPKLPTRVAAMSYFYDVAVDAGLIDLIEGGKVSVEKYVGAAERACTASNIDQPWACLDLVYIISLLHDAYNIANTEPISLYKKIHGHEVSWALGLAYTTVMNGSMTAA